MHHKFVFFLHSFEILDAVSFRCMFTLETGITKQDLEKQDNKLICNIGQPCLYLRNQQFRDTWFKKYGNTQDCNDVNH